MSIQTGTFLDRIVARTLADLPARQAAHPLAELDARAASRPPAIPFDIALRGTKTAVIAEVKRASPSKGAIAPGIDAAAVARDYLSAGASAISVLTDTPFFQGSLTDLNAVSEAAHAAVTPRPVLRKDFLVDPYQVAEARVHGADAVLLIVALLKGTRLREMLATVRDYGLQALVEVHDEAELDEAVNAGAGVIGINNRDLRTFTVDLATSERLVPMIPADRTIVAESGIHTPEDLRRLAAAGAHAVLVGESLMLAADRKAALRGLTR
ncbi:indole-3-glycerol phosphate synthase TrpC [Nitrolancea hollandica]|uniref:Indole-3-glycerol phosphate synthase n=1 Tax=Nitrolancea hollandica Lb TaxID=1129897 RepID=I4EH68_9BACT|nr:indole-3-glycerol phosphate synthase TrpC [Nitrolancea hollandica]CCF84030.1 indole-3-glycerol-phosphate synthase (IGPS) [Nitrolancea hollandica Lb]